MGLFMSQKTLFTGFFKGICPKGNAIGRLEFELAKFPQSIALTITPQGHPLLYLPLCPDFFLYRRVNMFPLHGRPFRLKLVVANPGLAHL